MVNAPTTAAARPPQEAWQEIESLVYEVARLSKSDVTARDFYSTLLERAVHALAAVAGAIWIRNPAGQLQLEYQVNLAQTQLFEPSASVAHLKLLNQIATTAEPRAIAPRSGFPDSADAGNPTEFLLLVCPLLADPASTDTPAASDSAAPPRPVHAVIEIFQRTGKSPAAQQGYLDFLGALAELAADFHRNWQLRELRARLKLADEFDRFTNRVHASLDLDTTAFAICNDGRQLAGCDRLSVAVTDGSRSELYTVSGLDTVDARANIVRRLEELIEAVLATGDPLWYSGHADDLPPQLESVLQLYLDESHSRMLAILPLLPIPAPSVGAEGTAGETDAPAQRADPRPFGALIVERFDAVEPDEHFRERIEVLSRHSRLALQHALTCTHLPLLARAEHFKNPESVLFRKRLSRAAWWLIAIAAVVLLLAIVPADFEIQGRGELQPKVRRDVFAGTDGVVSEVRASHAGMCEAGEVLLTLRRPELELEFSRVLGELQTSRKRLKTIEASRLEMNLATASADARGRYNQLTAEEEELKVLLTGLEQQYQILKEQQAELEIRSPVSGQVLTWDVSQVLTGRPVQRGQVLMTVAEVDGPWVLEMRVADRDIGHVLAAQKERGDGLPVTFMLATTPGTTYAGTLEQVALSADAEEGAGATVLVTIAFDRQQIPRLRPGATVIPRIECGRKPLGYVWLHHLIEAIQFRLFF